MAINFIAVQKVLLLFAALQLGVSSEYNTLVRVSDGWNAFVNIQESKSTENSVCTISGATICSDIRDGGGTDYLALSKNGETSTVLQLTNVSESGSPLKFQIIEPKKMTLLTTGQNIIYFYENPTGPSTGSYIVTVSNGYFILKSYKAPCERRSYAVAYVPGGPGILVKPTSTSIQSSTNAETVFELVLVPIYVLSEDKKALIKADFKARVAVDKDQNQTYFVDPSTQLPITAYKSLYALARNQKILERFFALSKTHEHERIPFAEGPLCKVVMTGLFLNVYATSTSEDLLGIISGSEHDDRHGAKKYKFPWQEHKKFFTGKFYTLSKILGEIAMDYYAELKFKNTEDEFAIFKALEFSNDVVLHEAYSDGVYRFMGPQLIVMGAGNFRNSARCKIVDVQQNPDATYAKMHGIRITKSVGGRIIYAYLTYKRNEFVSRAYNVFLEAIKDSTGFEKSNELTPNSRLLTIKNRSTKIAHWSLPVDWQLGAEDNSTSIEITFNLTSAVAANLLDAALKRIVSRSDWQLIISPGEKEIPEMEVKFAGYKNKVLTVNLEGVRQ